MADYQNEYLTADIDGTLYGFDIILNIDAKKLMGNLISKYGIEGASHVTTVKTHLQISLTPTENGVQIDFLHKGTPEEKESIKDNVLEFRR